MANHCKYLTAKELPTLVKIHGDKIIKYIKQYKVSSYNGVAPSS